MLAYRFSWLVSIVLSLFHRRSNKYPQQTGFLIDSFLLAESAFLNQPRRQQLLIKGLKSNTRM